MPPGRKLKQINKGENTPHRFGPFQGHKGAKEGEEGKE
jgi:hypothetical protein